MVTMSQIQDYANRIAEAFHPERIILFGSHAYGTPTPDSDVDLLVVMPDGGNPTRKAIEIRRKLSHPGMSLDLVVRDPGVLQWRIDNEDWFLREITEKGKVLYETDGNRMGQEGGAGLSRDRTVEQRHRASA